MPGGDTGSGAGRDGADAAGVSGHCNPEHELREVSGTHVVVPQGPSWFAGPSLGEICRQISDHEQRQTGGTD